MDLAQIPKTFWHSASISILALTFGFIYISFSFGDLKVKFKDLELRSSAVTALEQSLSQQEKTIAEREKEVRDLNNLLEEKLMEIKTLKEQVAQLESENAVPGETKDIVEKLADVSADKEFEAKVAKKRSTQSELQSKQEELQRSYQSQKEIYRQIQEPNFIPFQQQQIQQQLGQ